MSEQRFRQFGLWVVDEKQDKYLDVRQVVDCLNEQQATIKHLQTKVNNLEREYQQLALDKLMVDDLLEKLERIKELEDDL